MRSRRLFLALACVTVLAANACRGPQSERSTEIGLGASALPNIGLAATLSHPVARREALEWRGEARFTFQFLDDSDLADDDFPPAGDWPQLALGLLGVLEPEARRSWTTRVGAVWFDARGEPNLVNEPGDYYGIYVGLGFRTRLTESISMGPDAILLAAYGGEEDDLVLVPQVVWGFSWHL